MRPSRMVLDKLRSKECLDLLLPPNAGLPGLCTLHTNSVRGLENGPCATSCIRSVLALTSAARPHEIGGCIDD
jgi:Flp pilus assembly CpaF family ATPase